MLPVDPWNSFPQVTDKFIIKSAGEFSQFFRGDPLCTVHTEKSYFVALHNSRNLRNIYHELIHTDSSEDWCLLPPDQYIAFSRQTSGITVSVTYGDRGYSGILLCRKQPAVADALSRMNRLTVYNMTVERHGCP